MVIPDSGVSRCHARVLTHNGEVTLEDLRSSNGTYVNGHRISGPVELGTGDEVQIGDTIVGLRRPTLTAPMRRPAPRRLAPPPHQSGQHPGPRRPLPRPPLDPPHLPQHRRLLPRPPVRHRRRRSRHHRLSATPTAANVGHRALARIGRVTGWIGTLLSILAVIVFIVVATALHTNESSLGGLIDRIHHEIDKVPSVNPPDVKSQTPAS